MRAYLDCGILAYGFVRARCEDCGASRAVAFSCKKRGFCPACCGRRMADTAARLLDEVLSALPEHRLPALRSSLLHPRAHVRSKKSVSDRGRVSLES